MNATRIGIAIVEQDGCYLVGQRGAGQVLAGHAEFPGGKCKAGESPVECAVRECREETGLEVTALDLLDETRFEYDHGAVELHFWLCRPNGENTNPTGEFQWIPGNELRELPFPEGNARVLERLQLRIVNAVPR